MNVFYFSFLLISCTIFIVFINFRLKARMRSASCSIIWDRKILFDAVNFLSLCICNIHCIFGIFQVFQNLQVLASEKNRANDNAKQLIIDLVQFFVEGDVSILILCVLFSVICLFLGIFSCCIFCILVP